MIRWESITEDRIESNLSKTKNIPPKALIFSDFCCTFAMSLMILLVLICSTKGPEIGSLLRRTQLRDVFRKPEYKMIRNTTDLKAAYA